MKSYFYFFCFLFSMVVSAQNSMSQVLKNLNNETVPYLKVEEIKSTKNLVFLDAREPKEFNVSHIENAIFVGFDNFDQKKVTSVIKDKNANIVVYCSIGVRSEKIGEKLLKLGYKNVYNLYGGIFEYKNNGGKVVDNQNKETDKIHTYNKEWSVYLKKGIKIYED
ncbi:MAG: rhodanese-like domain-containing protein [Bacteroidetes bacterium HGW-Bacteroidetes-3]|nr:MAG: rhodanese-like domain-containing protein [Bacteroidetes bacterium HGW-Bacteroidetes-3]